VDLWPVFLERRSLTSRTIQGVRCRSTFCRPRGESLRVRLLAAFEATVEKLNLHPDSRSSHAAKWTGIDLRADRLRQILDAGGAHPGDQLTDSGTL